MVSLRNIFVVFCVIAFIEHHATAEATAEEVELEKREVEQIETYVTSCKNSKLSGTH